MKRTYITVGVVIVIIVIILGGIWYASTSGSSSNVINDNSGSAVSTDTMAPSDTGTVPTESPAASPTPTATVAGVQSYTAAQVAQHGTATDCWTMVNGKVYNITPFVPMHPGGNVIVQACGTDGTSLYNEMRGSAKSQADAMMQKYFVGNLKS